MMKEQNFEPTMNNAVLPAVGLGLVAGFMFAGPQYLLNVPPALAEKIFLGTLLVSLASLVFFVVYLQSNRNLLQTQEVTS